MFMPIYKCTALINNPFPTLSLKRWKWGFIFSVVILFPSNVNLQAPLNTTPGNTIQDAVAIQQQLKACFDGCKGDVGCQAKCNNVPNPTSQDTIYNQQCILKKCQTKDANTALDCYQQCLKDSQNPLMVSSFMSSTLSSSTTKTSTSTATSSKHSSSAAHSTTSSNSTMTKKTSRPIPTNDNSDNSFRPQQPVTPVNNGASSLFRDHNAVLLVAISIWQFISG